MAIGKPRGKDGMRPVYVYDPRERRKKYVGSRAKLRGPGSAQELERDKQIEFSGKQRPDGKLTINAYADEWLRLHHGERTRRPAESTRVNNESNLRAFLADHGHKLLDGGITRRDALLWARQHPHNAKVVSAMYNDALDDEVCTGNPFANRRQPEPRGRKDIKPLTEVEVELLADIALRHWGTDGYGKVAHAWILFAAWVGCRPGETFGVTAADLDFANGLVTIRRVKKRGGSHPVDVVVFPKAAREALQTFALPSTGSIFQTITGRNMAKGALRYHWDPIRSRFRERITEQRWGELLEGQSDLAFYTLRHFAASVMADRGLSEYDIAAQLGNSPEVCREVYIHHYEDRARDRIRAALDRPELIDLSAERSRRITGNN